MVSQDAQIKGSRKFIGGIYRYLDTDLISGPLHDVLLMKKDKVELFRNKLLQSFREKFPKLDESIVRPLFKVKLYE